MMVLLTATIDVIEGRREIKTYPLTESDLEMLKWLPFFARRRFIAKIIQETSFDEEMVPNA